MSRRVGYIDGNQCMGLRAGRIAEGSQSGDDAMTAQSHLTIDHAEFISRLREAAELLPSPDAPGFADAFDRFGDARRSGCSMRGTGS